MNEDDIRRIVREELVAAGLIPADGPQTPLSAGLPEPALSLPGSASAAPAPGNPGMPPLSELSYGGRRWLRIASPILNPRKLEKYRVSDADTRPSDNGLTWVRVRMVNVDTERVITMKLLVYLDDEYEGKHDSLWMEVTKTFAAFLKHIGVPHLTCVSQLLSKDIELRMGEMDKTTKVFELHDEINLMLDYDPDNEPTSFKLEPW